MRRKNVTVSLAATASPSTCPVSPLTPDGTSTATTGTPAARSRPAPRRRPRDSPAPNTASMTTSAAAGSAAASGSASPFHCPAARRRRRTVRFFRPEDAARRGTRAGRARGRRRSRRRRCCRTRTIRARAIRSATGAPRRPPPRVLPSPSGRNRACRRRWSGGPPRHPAWSGVHPSAVLPCLSLRQSVDAPVARAPRAWFRPRRGQLHKTQARSAQARATPSACPMGACPRSGQYRDGGPAWLMLSSLRREEGVARRPQRPSSGRAMKKIEAIIKPFKLDDVKEALQDDRRAGHDGDRGQGLRPQKGHTEIYRGAEYVVDFVPKVKIEIVVPDDCPMRAVETIIRSGPDGPDRRRQDLRLARRGGDPHPHRRDPPGGRRRIDPGCRVRARPDPPPDPDFPEGTY